MLTANVEVSDGLVNGARGEVVHVVTKANGNVVVQFDNHSVGQVAIQSSVYCGSHGDAVPIDNTRPLF